MTLKRTSSRENMGPLMPHMPLMIVMVCGIYIFIFLQFCKHFKGLYYWIVCLHM